MEDRKQRLAALAAKAGRGTLQTNDNDIVVDSATTDITTNNNTDDAAHEQEIQHNDGKRKIRFRNYIPSDPKLIDSVQTRTDASVDSQSMNIENKKPRVDSDSEYLSMVHGKGTKSALQIALEKARSEISIQSNQLSNNNHSRQSINPSSKQELTTTTTTTAKTPKINADLKRNIQKKLNLLEKRTQKALIYILRDRLEQEATTTTISQTTTATDDLD